MLLFRVTVSAFFVKNGPATLRMAINGTSGTGSVRVEHDPSDSDDIDACCDLWLSCRVPSDVTGDAPSRTVSSLCC